MTEDKKRAAAIAAVMHHIQEEKAARMQTAMYGLPQMPPVSASMLSAASNPWRVSGRQAMMQMRNLMQMRAFNR